MVDRKAAAAAINDFLVAIGRDPEADEGLRGTGERVTDAFIDELCEGYGADPSQILKKGRIEGTTGVVLLRDIPVATTCPHHLMPAFGTATVGFSPNTFVAGIGSLARILDVASRRLSLQEQVGECVVEALMRGLEPAGAGCRLTLVHGCMRARGERAFRGEVETLALGGSWAREDRAFAVQVLGAGHA